MNVPIGANAIIVKDGKILLGRRGKEPKAGSWSTIGGFVELGESLEEALAREVMEEIGCKVVATKYLCSIPQMYDGRNTLDAYFVTTIEGTPQLSDEVSEFIWTDKLIPNMFSDKMRKVISLYFTQ